MMNLYRVVKELSDLTEYILENAITIDEDTGEVVDQTDELMQRFDQLTLSKEMLIPECIKEIKNLRAMVSALKENIKEEQKRVHTAERVIDGLSHTLSIALDGQKYRDVEGDVSYRSSSSIEILDKDFCDEEYGEWEKTFKPDKKKMKKAIQDGKDIKGIVLHTKVNTIIK